MELCEDDPPGTMKHVGVDVGRYEMSGLACSNMAIIEAFCQRLAGRAIARRVLSVSGTCQKTPIFGRFRHATRLSA